MKYWTAIWIHSTTRWRQAGWQYRMECQDYSWQELPQAWLRWRFVRCACENRPRFKPFRFIHWVPVRESNSTIYIWFKIAREKLWWRFIAVLSIQTGLHLKVRRCNLPWCWLYLMGMGQGKLVRPGVFLVIPSTKAVDLVWDIPREGWADGFEIQWLVEGNADVHFWDCACFISELLPGCVPLKTLLRVVSISSWSILRAKFEK